MSKAKRAQLVVDHFLRGLRLIKKGWNTVEACTAAWEQQPPRLTPRLPGTLEANRHISQRRFRGRDGGGCSLVAARAALTSLPVPQGIPRFPGTLDVSQRGFARGSCAGGWGVTGGARGGGDGPHALQGRVCAPLQRPVAASLHQEWRDSSARGVLCRGWSYLRLIDVLYHSALGSREIKKRKEDAVSPGLLCKGCGVWG